MRTSTLTPPYRGKPKAALRRVHHSSDTARPPPLPVATRPASNANDTSMHDTFHTNSSGIRYRHTFSPLPLNPHPRTALIVRATLARLPGESVADACIRVAGQDLWQTKREAKRTQERAEVQEKLRRLAQRIAERRVLEPNPSPRLLERWGEQDKRNAKFLGVSVEELQTAIQRSKLPDSLTPHQRRIADRKARIEARAAEARAMGFRDHRARVRSDCMIRCGGQGTLRPVTA